MHEGLDAAVVRATSPTHCASPWNEVAQYSSNEIHINETLLIFKQHQESSVSMDETPHVHIVVSCLCPSSSICGLAFPGRGLQCECVIAHSVCLGTCAYFGDVPALAAAPSGGAENWSGPGPAFDRHSPVSTGPAQVEPRIATAAATGATTPSEQGKRSPESLKISVFAFSSASLHFTMPFLKRSGITLGGQSSRISSQVASLT